eukprot:TRINITY_DN2164_c0_g1_i1.p1 TRINITY_DN2164_c0_g1~~TRINITY_DN2164_c0_g1_i1.p1  ORF type:complete len:223 (-),score=61.56 TRINITY_DN2164_c0_g1_i1:269-937(-)
MPLLSKKRKAVADGVFRAELNEFLKREFMEDGQSGNAGVGYAGVDIVNGNKCLEVRIMATRTYEVVGADDRRINELTSLIRQRFGFAEGSIVCNAKDVKPRGLSAVAQAETLRYKLMNSVAPRKAALMIQKVTMEHAAGCEIILSGKLRAQRAKHMKFRDGYMLKSGYGPNYFVRSATRHVYLRQGVLGVKVSIMTKTDETGKIGPPRLLPDVVLVEEPKQL